MNNTQYVEYGVFNSTGCPRKQVEYSVFNSTGCPRKHETKRLINKMLAKDLFVLINWS